MLEGDYNMRKPDEPKTDPEESVSYFILKSLLTQTKSVDKCAVTLFTLTEQEVQ